MDIARCASFGLSAAALFGNRTCHSDSVQLVPTRFDSPRRQKDFIAVIMSGVPARIQQEDGPPWANAPALEIDIMNRDLREALGKVVKMQHDLCVDRNIVLQQLLLLIRGRVADAQALVARAQDNGGAHAKIAHLHERFDVPVLIEVHDLLFQLTRPDQVRMVLSLLEEHFKRGVDLAAISRLCGADGPDGSATRPSRLTTQGRMLWQLLLLAAPVTRCEGYALYLKERALLQPAGASASLLATMPSASSSSMLGFIPRPREGQSSGSRSTCSSNTPQSDGSSPGSASNKRPERPIGPAPAAEDATQGADIATRVDM